jgi:Zn-finger nucleic acid-binding protein
MKCPNCTADLTVGQRDGVDADYCADCQGLWLSPRELDALEDEVFDIGDDEKGLLVFSSISSARKCPQCGDGLRTFSYRLHDIHLDYCLQGHGYWLDANEDKRVLELMQAEEEAGLKRHRHAEAQRASLLRQMQTSAFARKLAQLFR